MGYIHPLFYHVTLQCPPTEAPPPTTTSSGSSLIGSTIQRPVMKKQKSFCEQVSREEYERQAKDASNKAINELLTHLLNDDKMSEKERKKRMKQVSSEIFGDILYCALIFRRF